MSGDRYMGPFTRGFSILVLPISLQLHMHTSKAKNKVESYKHMCHIFCAFFLHWFNLLATDLFFKFLHILYLKFE